MEQGHIDTAVARSCVAAVARSRVTDVVCSWVAAVGGDILPVEHLDAG